MTIAASDTEFAIPTRELEPDARPNLEHDMLLVELKASHAREGDLIRDRDQLLERQTLLTREFEHRLVNGLQIVASLLSMQSRSATTPEAATQLTDASVRVAAIGRVHHRLHLLDKEERVDFRRYIQELCADLSALLLPDTEKRKILVSGSDGFLPVAIGIPLGFIVSELATNSAKYTGGDIHVHIADERAGHSLTVTDEGLGLPDDFDPAHGKGLGMSIIRSLVKQIGGTMHFTPGPGGKGTSVKVVFSSPERDALVRND